jgi:hypothetical protein
VFTNQFLFEKHKNRTIPCGVVLSCDRCKKTFISIKILETHKNRKFTCTILDENIKKTQKKEPKKNSKKETEKIKEMELKLEIQKLKKEEKEMELSAKREEKETLLELQKLKKEQKEMELRARKEEKEMEINAKLEIRNQKVNELKEKQQKKEMSTKEYMQMQANNAEIKKQTLLELQKLKNEQKESDLKLKQDIQKKKELANKDYINLYAHNSIIKKDATLEIIDAKAEKSKEIELIKSERKGVDIDKQNIRLCRKIIREKYLKPVAININKIYKNAIERYNLICEDDNKKKSVTYLVNMYNRCNKGNKAIIEEFIAEILELSYKNPRAPEEQCIFYIKEFNHYFIGYYTESLQHKLERHDFNISLLPVFKEIIRLYLIKVIDFVPKYNKIDICIDICINKSNTEIENFSCDYLNRFLNKDFSTQYANDIIRDVSNKVFKIDYK